MQINKGTSLKWIAISFGIVSCVALAAILIIPSFISDNFIKQTVTHLLEDKSETIHEVGSISFHWPNRINISHLSIQKQNREAPIRFEDIQGTVKLFPLLVKKFVIKKISIQQINYENQLLIKNLVTDEFSFKNGILFINARLQVNDGPTTIRGTIDLHQKEPVFDIFIDGRDVSITQDVQTLRILPILTVKEGEIGGILSLEGYIKGKGLGKEILNEELNADMNLKIRDGYIRGNKVFSSLLEIVGINDGYSFDSMEAVIQIKDGKIYTPKMETKGPLMSLNASGMADFEGRMSYDALVKFNEKLLSKNVEKIVSLVLKQNALPIEIRGTTKDPRVSVKLPKDNLEYLIKGLVNDFLSTPKKKQRNEKN